MSAFGSARAVVTPLRTCQTGLSGHGGSPPSWLDSLLNCNVVPVVLSLSRISMTVLSSPMAGQGCQLPRSRQPTGSSTFESDTGVFFDEVLGECDLAWGYSASGNLVPRVEQDL